jgi:predicted nucleotidyltransferase
VDVDDLQRRAIAALRDAGASFAYVHGSRASGTARADSDLDVAAFWGTTAPAPFEVDTPVGVDLLVLDTAPLELRGRIAEKGVLLYEDDPAARVHWEAMTRKIWFDERPRIERAHREFAAALARGGDDGASPNSIS